MEDCPTILVISGNRLAVMVAVVVAVVVAVAMLVSLGMTRGRDFKVGVVL